MLMFEQENNNQTINNYINTDAISFNSYLTKVFGYLGFGIILTAITHVIFASSPFLLSIVFQVPYLFLGLVIAEIALVFYINARIHKMSFNSALTWFFIYSISTGITITPMLIAYSSQVLNALILTIVFFIIFAGYGYITKTDLSKIGNIALVSFIGLFVVELINVFILASSGLDIIISVAMLIIFAVLIARKIQILKEYHAVQVQDAELSQKLAVLGALSLYISFVIVFMRILRLLSKR